MRDLGLAEEKASWVAWRLGSEACIKLYAIEGITVEVAIGEMRQGWAETVAASTDPVIKMSEIDDVETELSFHLDAGFRAEQRESEFQAHLDQQNAATLAARQRPAVFSEADPTPAPRAPAQAISEAEEAIARGVASPVKSKAQAAK
jgi:hypothetical protein